MFYKYVIVRLKQSEGITELKVNGEMDELEWQRYWIKASKECSQEKVSSTNQSKQTQADLSYVTEEVIKEIENLDVRKSEGPDGISNWVLRV